MLNHNHRHVLAHSLESFSRSLSGYSNNILMSQIQYIRDRMIISSWQAKYETSARWGWDVIVELLPCTQALPPIQSPGKEFQPTNLSLVTDILETIPSDSACQTLTLLKSWSLGVQKKNWHTNPQKNRKHEWLQVANTQKSKQWPWKTRLKDPWLIFGTLF